MNVTGKKFGIFIGGALAVATVAGAGALHAQDAASPEDAFNIPENVVLLGQLDPNDRTATAKVNGAVITGTDVDHRVALVLASNEATDIPAEELQRLRLQTLRNLIDETLQIQEAVAQDMAVTQDEIDRTYSNFATQRFNMTKDEMDNYLRSVGSSPASMKRQMEGELAWQRLLQRNVQPFVSVSTEEVNELYDRLQATQGEPEYRLGEIYLSATPATSEAVAQNAQRIVDQLRQGGNFAAYARQFSEASTAAVGGDLGWIRLQQLQNPTLEQAASQLQPGQLIGPIDISGGYSILYLIEKRQVGMADPRDAVLSLKQISFDFPAGTTEAKAQELTNTFTQTVQAIRGCGEADAAAARIGAAVVTNDQVPARALPEALQGALLQLNVGQATPPFGALDEGVRVLMLCGRDDPEVATGPNYDEIMAQLEDDRIGKRAQRYLRDLRRDAVIEYN